MQSADSVLMQPIASETQAYELLAVVGYATEPMAPLMWLQRLAGHFDCLTSNVATQKQASVNGKLELMVGCLPQLACIDSFQFHALCFWSLPCSL